MKSSNINDSTISAYANANYYVIAEQSFYMKIGQKSKPLQNYCFKKNYQSAVFVTGYNPFSKIATDMLNLLAHNKLKLMLNNMDIEFILCVASDLEKDWPDEVGVLALDVTLQKGKDIGNKFKQNAIVWISDSWVPKIELLR
mgnify:FL=1